jgi:hypothetical protein
VRGPVERSNEQINVREKRTNALELWSDKKGVNYSRLVAVHEFRYFRETCVILVFIASKQMSEDRHSGTPVAEPAVAAAASAPADETAVGSKR